MGNKSSSSSSLPPSDPFAPSVGQQNDHFEKKKLRAHAKVKKEEAAKASAAQAEYATSGHLPPVPQSSIPTSTSPPPSSPVEDDDPPPLTSTIDPEVPADEVVALRLSTRKVNPDGSITITTRTLLGETSITVPPPPQQNVEVRHHSKYSDSDVINFIIDGNFQRCRQFVESVGNGNPNHLGVFNGAFNVVHIVCALNCHMLEPLLETYGHRVDFNVCTGRALQIPERADSFYRSTTDYLQFVADQMKSKVELPSALKVAKPKSPTAAEKMRPMNKSLHWTQTPCYDHCNLDGECLHRDVSLSPLHLLIIFQPMEFALDAISKYVLRYGGDFLRRSGRLLMSPLHLAVKRSGEDMKLAVEAWKEEEKQKRMRGDEAAIARCNGIAGPDPFAMSWPSPLLELVLMHSDISSTNLSHFTGKDIAEENDFHKKVYEDTLNVMEEKCRFVWRTMGGTSRSNSVGKDVVKIIVQYMGWEGLAVERKIIEGKFSGEEEWGTEEQYYKDDKDEKEEWKEKNTDELNDEELEAALERQLAHAMSQGGGYDFR